MTTAAPRRALIINSDPNRIQELSEALRGLGIDVEIAHDATEGWQAFVRKRPTHVFAGISTAATQCGEHFLRKLNSDFLGAMPEVFFNCSAEELAEIAPSDPTAYMLWPVALPVLESIFATRARPALGDTAGRQVARLRELYEVTLLGPSLIAQLDFACSRAALGFQVSNCVIWGPEDEEYWPRSTTAIPKEHWPSLRAQCELAMQAATTVIVSGGRSTETLVPSTGRSLLAAPLGPMGELPVAGICLIDAEGRRFSSEARDSIRILARRLSSELAWMSAHNRLVDEHEKLRQTALLDPMLGVWTRPALQEAIAHRISSERRHGTSLAILLLDFVQLRAINDRHGHLTGDAVLAHFAKVVGTCLRAQDQLGRFAGDKLAALLVGTTLDDAKNMAIGIVQELAAAPFRDGESQIPIEVRVGATIIDAGETGSDAAFGRAQVAVDTAKHTGAPVAAVESSSGSSGLNLGPSQGDLLSAGSTLGGMYRILHEISRGSMGVVYRGEDLGLGRPIAIKVLRSDLSSDEVLVSKFRSEAALLASLRHRNLVQVYSFGTEGEDVYFVMELVEGEPLSQIIRRLAGEGRYVDLEAVAKIVEEIAEALDAIHSLGIVHRDVKPDNVLVDRINDRAVLVDVGIAKRVGDARDAAGTPGFAAPESFMEADESPPTDVYGLATTTYAVLTGSSPYEGDDVSLVVKQQLSEPPLPITSMRSDLSKAVDQVLATALAPDPKQRYRSANAFAIALNRALARQPRPAHVPGIAGAIPPAQGRPSTVRDGRISTYRVTPIPRSEAGLGVGLTRGALFRALGIMLSHQLGSQWIEEIAASDPRVGELLKPTLPPQSWHSTEHLRWLLRCADGHEDAPPSLLRDLGAAAAVATLARFYGADPRTQSPGSLLKAAESYWRRYHSWGDLVVRLTGDSEALLELSEGPADALLCELFAGMFGQIPALAGGADTRCEITTCRRRGDELCTFAVQWTPGTIRTYTQ